MFESDWSAARGKMSICKLIVFKHNSEFGNTPSHKLFEKIKVNLKDGKKFVSGYDDYEIEIDRSVLPENVALLEMV